MPDKVITSATPCDCCGEAEPCYFTFPPVSGFPIPIFPIDGTDSPYPDEATAEDALANQAGDCLTYLTPRLDELISRTFSATLPGNVLTVSDVTVRASSSEYSQAAAFKGYFLAAAGLSIAYNFDWSAAADAGALLIEVYDITGTVVDSFSISSVPASGTFNVTIPSDGFYYVLVSSQVSQSTPTGGTYTLEFEADGGASAQFCVVRAAYGETPDYLVCAP